MRKKFEKSPPINYAVNMRINIKSPLYSLPQKRIDLREGLGAEKASVGAEWRRMCTLNDKVSVGTDEPLFALGMLAPQDKNNGRGL